MKLLFYRYGSICEPDIIAGFQELGLEVSELTEEISNQYPHRNVFILSAISC